MPNRTPTHAERLDRIRDRAQRGYDPYADTSYLLDRLDEAEREREEEHARWQRVMDKLNEKMARLDEAERLLREAERWVSGGPKAEEVAAEIRDLLGEDLYV